MRKAVRAIVIKDGQLLVMHRNKFGKEYYSLIGGGIDYGETAEQALAREIHEETGVQCRNPRLVYVQEAGDPYGTQYIYVCDYVSGEPQLHPASAEASITALGQNLYEPMWVPLANLAQLPFVAEVLRDAIVRDAPNNFSNAPQNLYGS